MMMRGGDEGLKGCAARTGKPDSALDPRTATPRLADMPFRRGGSAAAGSVTSTCRCRSREVAGFGAVSVFAADKISAPPRAALPLRSNASAPVPGSRVAERPPFARAPPRKRGLSIASRVTRNGAAAQVTA